MGTGDRDGRFLLPPSFFLLPSFLLRRSIDPFRCTLHATNINAHTSPHRYRWSALVVVRTLAPPFLAFSRDPRYFLPHLYRYRCTPTCPFPTWTAALPFLSPYPPPADRARTSPLLNPRTAPSLSESERDIGIDRTVRPHRTLHLRSPVSLHSARLRLLPSESLRRQLLGQCQLPGQVQVQAEAAEVVQAAEVV